MVLSLSIFTVYHDFPVKTYESHSKFHQEIYNIFITYSSCEYCVTLFHSIFMRLSSSIYIRIYPERGVPCFVVLANLGIPILIYIFANYIIVHELIQ